MNPNNPLEKTEPHIPDHAEDEQVKGSTYQRYLLEILREEMKIISAAITDHNRKSTQIKQWCLTLWMATWGVISIDYVRSAFMENTFILLLAPAIFPVFFLFFGYFEQTSRAKVYLSRKTDSRFLERPWHRRKNKIEQRFAREISGDRRPRRF